MSIWAEGSKAFAENSAASGMIKIMFIAIGSFIVISLTSTIGKLKMASALIGVLATLACIQIFLKPVVEIIDFVGKVFGL